MGNFLSTILSSAWATIKTFEFKDAIDIIVVAFILYYLLKLLRQSRVGQLLKGVVILLVAYALSAVFNLTMINYILKALFEFAIIILVVVFQPELRQVLEKLGHNKTFKNIVTPNTAMPYDNSAKAISDVSDACALFSKTRTGALIVFDRYPQQPEGAHRHCAAGRLLTVILPLRCSEISFSTKLRCMTARLLSVTARSFPPVVSFL